MVDDGEPSEQTTSMRKAAQHILRKYNNNDTNRVRDELTQLNLENHSVSVNEVRTEALKVFLREDHHHCCCVSNQTLAVVDINEIHPEEFRRTYHRANIPCLVRGLGETAFFKFVMDNWVKDGRIDRNWFRQHVGSKTLVPIRRQRQQQRQQQQQQQQQQTSEELDSEGRAVECETVQITMEEWLATSATRDPTEYLKDWHLQNLFSETNTLYSLPEIFQYDLLNDFLMEFTDGDYRFVYWGPAGSKTPLHSDVLNSFSWSYNVCGQKTWRFYPPGTDSCITAHQSAGEAIFVPSGWKHDVVNTVETLSINHNWITTANLDQTLDCVLMELKAVEHECQEWGTHSLEAKESMLRGCVGLDLTSLFLMILKRIVDTHEIDLDETDSASLVTAVSRLLDDSFDLRARLEATLQDNNLAQKCIEMATTLLHR